MYHVAVNYIEFTVKVHGPVPEQREWYMGKTTELYSGGTVGRVADNSIANRIAEKIERGKLLRLKRPSSFKLNY